MTIVVSHLVSLVSSTGYERNAIAFTTFCTRERNRALRKTPFDGSGGDGGGDGGGGGAGGGGGGGDGVGGGVTTVISRFHFRN